MCVLCYELAGEGHWTDAAAPASATGEPAARGRYRRTRILNAVLAPAGLTVRTPGPGRSVVVANRKGASEVAVGLGAVWEAADRLGSRRVDLLDPALLDALGSGRASDGDGR
jgi:hypothetical protein